MPLNSVHTQAKLKWRDTHSYCVCHHSLDVKGARAESRDVHVHTGMSLDDVSLWVRHGFSLCDKQGTQHGAVKSLLL
jgi:hypothetical protein